MTQNTNTSIDTRKKSTKIRHLKNNLLSLNERKNHLFSRIKNLETTHNELEQKIADETLIQKESQKRVEDFTGTPDELQQKTADEDLIQERCCKKIDGFGTQLTLVKKNIAKEHQAHINLEQEKIILESILKDVIQKQRYQKKIYFSSVVVAVALSAVFISYSFFAITLIGQEYVIMLDQPHRTSYLIENLRGDTIDTWVSWRMPEDDLFHAHIVNSPLVTEERAQAIFDVIMSQEKIDIDDSLLHKGPQGSVSTYYLGWYGALNSIEQSTEFPVPKNLHFHITDIGEGDVLIKLESYKDPDGYSGFTKSIVDDTQNQILKSQITIYDVNGISERQIQTILRHELGHGFGLAHSTAPEDLMYPEIRTEYPYISDCDLDAIVLLYDGGKSSQVVCEK